MRASSLALTSVILACFVGTSSAQFRLYDIWGPADWANFGRSIAVVGDVDGDGGVDYWVGAPGVFNDQGFVTGAAYLLSGVDGDVVRSSQGLLVRDYYGSHLATLGDLDGDGISEVLIGAPQVLYVPYKSSWQNPAGAGYAQVRSGATAEILHQPAGLKMGSAFGAAGSDIGDVDGDLVPDYAIGAPRRSTGEVFVYSGATGDLLRIELPSDPNALGWGFHLAPFVDVDNDGVDEHLVSAVPEFLQSAAFSVSLVSGADGSTLWTQSRPASSLSEYGYRTLAIDDLNMDGIPEVLVGAKRANQYKGYVEWLDGSSGAVLQQKQGTLTDGTFGASMARIGDTNGNGLTEVAIGLPCEGTQLGFGTRLFLIYEGFNPVGSVHADGLHTLSFGTALAAGDVNGDNRPDMIVGTPNEDIAYIWQGGRIEVFTNLLGGP